MVGVLQGRISTGQLSGGSWRWAAAALAQLALPTCTRISTS